jgi:3-keto-5-aminohexanoate cleavage enzyme
MEELMICVAPYPGEKQEEKFPGRMDVVEEVVNSYNAGASIAHLHVRDADGLQTVDTTFFQQNLERIRARSPIIIEGSTGGTPEHKLEERCVSFTVPGVEMGSLNLGSINLWDGVYSNKVADILFYARELHKRGLKPFIDCFDLSHFNNLAKLEQEKLVITPHVFGLVFDIPNSLPYSDRYLDIFLEEIPAGSIWFLARHHAHGSMSFLRALEKGGHVRVGYEDGPFLAEGKRARSNAELIEDIVKAARKVGRKIVDPNRAREIMQMKRT